MHDPNHHYEEKDVMDPTLRVKMFQRMGVLQVGDPAFPYRQLDFIFGGIFRALSFGFGKIEENNNIYETLLGRSYSTSFLGCILA